MFRLDFPGARTTGLFASALVLGALSACGGGGGSSTNEPTAIETTFSGAVKDATTSAAIAGATISVGLKSSATPATATTSADGSYSLKLATSSLNTAASAVVTVTATGYLPCSIEVSSLQANGETRSLTGCSRLTATANQTGTYAPAEGAVITRLGNNSGTSGDVLSRLSTVAAGTRVDIKIGSINQTTACTNTNFVTSLKIRGMEPRTCADKITLYQVAETPLLVAQGSNGLVDSDATGAFSTYTFPLLVSNLPTTGDLYIRIESGACGAGSADQADDFEIYDLNGSFTS